MSSRITDRIIDKAETKHLKNKDLAKLFGVTPQFVSDCKSGRSNFTEKQIIKFLVHNRDVDAHWLIHGETQANKTYNITTGGKNTVAESGYLEIENKHLKDLIREKEEQIKLYKKMLNM